MGTQMDQITWNFDNLREIGGQKMAVHGDPQVVASPWGKAIHFDGVQDGLTLDLHPLEAAAAFTIELVFRPESGGMAEQRFFHLQEGDSENRVLVETRLTGDGQWYLDTFIASGKTNQTLIDPAHLHPLDKWQHAALVFDGRRMSHYVGGKEELSAVVPEFHAPRPGKTSIGVRLNKVCWFKGDIATARLSRCALSPQDFLRIQ